MWVTGGIEIILYAGSPRSSRGQHIPKPFVLATRTARAASRDIKLYLLRALIETLFPAVSFDATVDRRSRFRTLVRIRNHPTRVQPCARQLRVQVRLLILFSGQKSWQKFSRITSLVAVRQNATSTVLRLV